MSANKVPPNPVGLGALIVGLAILVIAVCIGGMLLFQSQISGTRAPSSTVAPAIVSAPTPTASASDTPASTATPSPAPSSTPTTVPTVELGTSNVFIEYILDASGSMTGTLSDGSVKIDLAKRVLTDHMRSFRPETNIGLRAYGHRLPYQEEAESCKDIELVAPVEKGQMERIVGFLQDFEAQGMTPLAASLQQAKEDFVYEAPRINSIILLSDGIETCRGDPCKLVEDLKAQGINFTIHVIGLDVDDPTREQLSCIAQAGGGTYHDAKSQLDLGAALEAVKTNVTKDEVVVPVGVATPTPLPTTTPSPSPTNALVNFTSAIAFGLSGDIWLVEPTTGRQHKLVDLSSESAGDPAWSLDGKKLAFGLLRSDYRGDIGILDMESGEVQKLGLPEKSDTWHGSAYTLAWTPDGSMIYYSMATELMGRYQQLRRVRSDGSGQVEIPSISRGWEWEGFPAFSPDGRWMTYGMMQKYYLVDWPADYWAIWRAQADESDSQQLVIGLNGQSSWSPDSTQIAYDTHWFKGDAANDSIHLMDADGNYLRQLTADGLDPSWSPDSQAIAFTRTAADGTSKIWVMNSDGSNARMLTAGSEPAWRPVSGASVN